jgi:hypothetical protein
VARLEAIGTGIKGRLLSSKGLLTLEFLSSLVSIL